MQPFTSSELQALADIAENSSPSHSTCAKPINYGPENNVMEKGIYLGSESSS